MPRNNRLPAECDRALKWLRDSHWGPSMVTLTGQDARALRAFIHAVELYGASDVVGRQAALDAMTALVRAAQPKVRPLFREVIAAVLDRNDREPIWRQVGGDERLSERSAS